MGKWQKIAIALVPIVAIAFVVFLALRPIRTDSKTTEIHRDKELYKV
jgi:hypothetical protein